MELSLAAAQRTHLPGSLVERAQRTSTSEAWLSVETTESHNAWAGGVPDLATSLLSYPSSRPSLSPWSACLDRRHAPSSPAAMHRAVCVGCLLQKSRSYGSNDTAAPCVREKSAPVADAWNHRRGAVDECYINGRLGMGQRHPRRESCHVFRSSRVTEAVTTTTEERQCWRRSSTQACS
jgi:hypothetical protein